MSVHFPLILLPDFTFFPPFDQQNIINKFQSIIEYCSKKEKKNVTNLLPFENNSTIPNSGIEDTFIEKRDIRLEKCICTINSQDVAS